LQIEPELSAIAKIAPKPYRRVSGDRSTKIENISNAAGRNADIQRSRLALRLRAAISRFSSRPGCITGAIVFTLCGNLRFRLRRRRPCGIRSKHASVIARQANQLKILSSPFEKNFPLNPSSKSTLDSRHPVPRRGALAIVTNVRTGCGGRGSVAREMCLQGGFP